MMNFIPLNFVLQFPLYVILIYFVLCVIIAIAGRKKTMGFWGFLYGSILLSPIMGFLMLVIARDKK